MPDRATRSGLRLRTALLAIVAALAFAPPLAGRNEQPGVIHQLRVYEIFENNKQAFHERFRDHAMRIMAKYDFRIVAMWETNAGGRTESSTCSSGRTAPR